MRIHTYLSLLCLCLSWAVNITAQTTWQGPANGDWFTPANWNNGLPAPGNNATIGGSAIVVVGAPLTVNFTIDVFGGLTFDAAVTNSGAINISGSLTVNTMGSLTNNASLTTFFGSTTAFQSAATFTNEAGASFTNGGSFNLQTTLVNKGSATNNGTIDAINGTLNSQGTFQNNKILTTKTLTVAAGSSFTNDFGSTLNITGVSATFLANGTVTNNGIINNGGSMTVASTFNSNGQLNNSGSLTINAGATLNHTNQTLENTGTLTNNGSLTVFTTLTNSGTLNNNSTYNNNNLLNNLAGGTFNNNAGGVINQGFGSELQNAGAFNNAGSIISVGLIQNDATFTNNGSLVCNSGNKFDNNGSNFTNNGTMTTSNLVQNDGSFFNFGTMNVNGGSVIDNFGGFTNRPGAVINNLGEVKSKVGGVFTNNGTLNNAVRVFVEGNFINNAYLNSTGNIFIETGGTLTNSELLYLNAGNLKNQGTLVNSNKIWVNDCSSLNNVAGATINNNGNLELHGILFQRGTVNGNAVNNQGGYIHTAAGSAAPSICQNGTFPADINGDVKVYASQLISNANFDSCANIVYLANGVDRPVFACTDIGSVLNVSVVLRTSLNDELTCTAQVTPVDLLEPQFASCPKDQLIFTPNSTVPATWTAPTATDNCTAVTLTSSHTSGSSFPVGITGVTYTAKDTYNNTNLCQFRIEVRKTAPGSNCSGDATPPAFAGCPANISKTTNGASATAAWLPPSATDNCYPIVLTSSHAPGASFGLGSTTVTYTAKDGNNNSGTCTFTVTVTQNNACAGDVTKPVINSCPKNMYLATNAAIGGAVAVWTPPGAFDLCGVTQFTGSHVSGFVFATGTTTVTYTAKDAANNTSTCSFTVTVGADPCPGDVTAPLISGCPANINLTVPGNSATATWTAPTAGDPCAPVITNATHTPGSTFSLGSTQVSYQFSDKKGNTSVCNFNVNVQNVCDVDATNPVISNCPSTVTVGTAGTSAAATWTPPTATDNCGLVYFAAAYLPGAVFPVGTTTIVYTALDSKGNAASCSFNVIVVNAPGCTSNAAPINGTTNVNPASVALLWVTAAGATAYDVYLGTTNPPTTAVATNVAATSTTVTGLLGGTTYWWYVVPKNPAGSATGCGSTATNFVTSSVTCNVCTGNLLTNGCFENGLTGFVASGGATTTSPGRTGALAGYLCNNGSKLEYPLTGVVGGIYTFSGWATKPNNNTTGNFSIVFKNSAGTVLATTSSTLNLNAWKQYTATATAPANTASVVATITKTSTSGCITTDDWCMTVVLPCNNVTNAGTIAAAQSICPNADPVAFASTAAASGGTGTLSYKWQRTTLDPATNPNSWTDIAGATSESYDSPALAVTTWFRRGATRSNCSAFLFTAALKVTVGNLPPTAICQNITRTQTAAGQSVQISGADVNNGSTPGCGTITSLNISPTSFSQTGTFSVTLTVTNSAGLSATCTATVTILPPPGCTPVNFSKRVNASSDDAEEIVSGGSVDLNSSDLELGTDGGAAQIVGMRFTGVTIPKGATILSAYIEFETDETNSGITNLTFKGQAADDASTFSSSSGNLSSRAKTTASVAWNNVPAWNTVNQKWQSPDLKAIVQEIVNRSGWVSGNDLAMFVTGSGERVAEAYDGESPAAPLLVISYDPCVCSNVTNGGTIAKSCGSGNINFSNVTLPSGGTGTLEYMWISGTTDCNPDNMTPVAGANAATLTVAPPSVTTYYIRCSRRSGCTDWVGESNCITVEAFECQYDANKCYKVVNKYSGKVLDIYGAELNDNTRAIQWTEHGGDNQKFRLSYAGGGNWYILARHSNKFLDTENAGSTADNAKAVQYTFDGSNSQQWKIESVGSGYVKFINKLSGKALKISSASTADGVDAVQLNYSNSDLFKWQIVEVACCEQDALLVVGSTTLGAGDNWVKTRLETLGFTVTVKDDDAVVSADANAKGLVVISSTVNSTSVNTKFTNSQTPVVSWESYLFDDLKMTYAGEGTDYGTATGSSVVINDATHPLAGGLSGTVQVYTTSGPMRWGWTTNSSAAKVAKTGSANQYAIFAYEKGGFMQEGFNAPARRVGLFMEDNTPQTLTAHGIRLFDGAINWASRCNGYNLDKEEVIDRSETPENEQPTTQAAVESGKAIIVYPNPAHDRLYMNLSEFAGKEALVRLFNANGQLTKEWKIVAFEEPVELPLEDSRSGYHVLWVLPEGEKRATAVKVIIER